MPSPTVHILLSPAIIPDNPPIGFGFFYVIVNIIILLILIFYRKLVLIKNQLLLYSFYPISHPNIYIPVSLKLPKIHEGCSFLSILIGFLLPYITPALAVTPFKLRNTNPTINPF